MINKLFYRNKADISVIIPFYNVDNYIAECLDSLLAQEGVSLDIILVDDGSNDNSRSIAEEYRKQHDNIRIYDADNIGPGRARDMGVKHARGEYIAFLDADDLLVPGIYKRMLGAVKTQNAEVCICNVARFNTKKERSSDLHDKIYKNYQPCTNIRENPLLVYDTTVWNKLIKRAFYTKERLSFPEDIITYEDIVFNADMHLKCKRVAMIAETGYMWRERDNNTEASLSQMYHTDQNINDRLKASQFLIDLYSRADVPKGTLDAAKYKLLERDFKIMLDSLKVLSEDDGKRLMILVKEFIDKNIEQEIIEKLPVVDIQRYEHVKQLDAEGYKKVLLYRNESYGKAAIEENEGVLTAILPEEIITVEKRSVNDDFAHRNRRVWVDNIEKPGDDIEISAHCYIQRYNMANPDDQRVQVLLINEETNDIIEVKTKPFNTHFLTEKFGVVYDETTGIESKYNYDFTGFSFKVKDALEDIPLELDNTKFSVIAEYKDRLFEGRQIIKGVEKRNKEKYEAISIQLKDRSININLGRQNELQIVVSKLQ